MALTKSRRAPPKITATSLPNLAGRWTEDEIDGLTQDMLRELDEAAAGASSSLSAKGHQIVTVASWIIAQKKRSEEWLRIAFERIDKLERELKQVKATPRLTYKGAWRQGQETLPGDFVTFQGSVWHCNKKTLSRPGDDPGAFTLAVKHGRDGKDA